jgi:hypothetical protein
VLLLNVDRHGTTDSFRQLGERTCVRRYVRDRDVVVKVLHVEREELVADLLVDVCEGQEESLMRHTILFDRSRLADKGFWTLSLTERVDRISQFYDICEHYHFAVD